jgi:hypothetical protein
MPFFKCNFIFHSCILIMLNKKINFHKLPNNCTLACDCNKLGILLTCDKGLIMWNVSNGFSNWKMK